MINLESLNQVANTLDTEYIKTSLSSDTMDNLIQKLSSNLITKTYVDGAYRSHTLYTGSIAGNTTKEFNLKLWMDYDTTKEQGASKVYTSKINVIANPDLEVNSTPEIKTTLVDNTLSGTITGSASSAKYCTTSDNICIPSTSASISSNKVNIVRPTGTLGKTRTVAFNFGNIEVNVGGKAIICTTLNSGKTYCSNPVETEVSPDFSKVATTDEGVYAVSDGMYGGTSYYWRGAVTNNYVKFAGFCWRIIRINGDGSIRLIYDGTTCHANEESTTDSIAVASVTYNTSKDQSNYVGWTYEGILQRPTSNANATESNVKKQTDSWYDSHIGNNSMYTSKLDLNGKFCNDRNAISGSWVVNPSSDFLYRGFRVVNPTLNCPNGDMYTLKVGAITVDETIYAGGKNVSNDKYYLYNGQAYWTMSPAYCYYSSYSGSNSAGVIFVDSSGSTLAYPVTFFHGVRPVINLKSDTKFVAGGEGTQTLPYIVAD